MMKKRIFALLLSLMLMVTMAVPVFAAAEDVPFSTMVVDQAELLTPSELYELDMRAWEITHTYQCAVYVVTLDSLDGFEAWEAAELLHTEYAMGYGEDQSCIILLLSTEDRSYDLMAYGYGNVAFTDYGKDQMAAAFLDEFEYDDWYGGFVEYLDCCDEYLQAARNGKPVSQGRSPILGIAIATIFPTIAAFLVCANYKAKMLTARMQTSAQGYIDEQGLVLTGQNDMYLHTTRTERKIEKESKSGGTTVNSNGSSHKSGKF